MTPASGRRPVTFVERRTARAGPHGDRDEEEDHETCSADRRDGHRLARGGAAGGRGPARRHRRLGAARRRREHVRRRGRRDRGQRHRRAAWRARWRRRRWPSSRAGASRGCVTYGISDELAGTVGLMCGGTVHIFVHEIRLEARQAVVCGLRAMVEERPSAVATLLDGPHAGGKLYVDAHTRVGTLGGPDLLDRNVEREARGLVAHGRTTVRRFGEDGTTLGTGLRVHVTAHAEPPRMVIFGAIDFSAALARDGLGPRLPGDHRRPAARVPRLPALRRLRGDRRGVAGGGPRGDHARPARRGARLHPRPEARRAGPDGRVRDGGRIRRCAREPPDERRPRGAPARGRRDGRRPAAGVRAVRSRHRRRDGGGDGDRRAGRDDRAPRAPLRRVAARLRGPDPPPAPGRARARLADAGRPGAGRSGG